MQTLQYTRKPTNIKSGNMKLWTKHQLKKTALSILLNHAGVSDDVVFCHILPWVQQFKFKEETIPRMLVEYTRIENPSLLDEYNKFTDFKAALNIPQLIEKTQGSLREYEDKFYGVLKNCDDYCELDKLPFFLLMMKESEGIKIESDGLDFYKGELLGDEWDFSEYSFYLEALCDRKFSEQLFDKLLIDHKYLLQVKN